MRGISEIIEVNEKAAEEGNAEREYIIENRSIFARSWSEAMHKFNLITQLPRSE